MKVSYLLVALFGMLAFEASAQSECANYKKEGSLFSGRRFTNWDIVPVSPDVAMKRIKIEAVGSGLILKAEDKDAGLLVFEQHLSGGTGQITMPSNVVVTPEGKAASKVAVTRTVPSGYATGEGYQRESLCFLINAAYGKK